MKFIKSKKVNSIICQQLLLITRRYLLLIYTSDSAPQRQIYQPLNSFSKLYTFCTFSMDREKKVYDKISVNWLQSIIYKFCGSKFGLNRHPVDSRSSTKYREIEQKQTRKVYHNREEYVHTSFVP